MLPRAALLSLVLLAACGGGGGLPRFSVEGSDGELARLAGSWRGDYQGDERGRSGTVRFSFRTGQHTAEGEVVLGGATPLPLPIELVQVQGGQVRGTIAPYTDPSCACRAETRFLGTLAGDTISGSFETRLGDTGQVRTGSWMVTRQAR